MGDPERNPSVEEGLKSLETHFLNFATETNTKLAKMNDGQTSFESKMLEFAASSKRVEEMVGKMASKNQVEQPPNSRPPSSSYQTGSGSNSGTPFSAGVLRANTPTYTYQRVAVIRELLMSPFALHSNPHITIFSHTIHTEPLISTPLTPSSFHLLVPYLFLPPLMFLTHTQLSSPLPISIPQLIIVLFNLGKLIPCHWAGPLGHSLKLGLHNTTMLPKFPKPSYPFRSLMNITPLVGLYIVKICLICINLLMMKG